MTSLEELSTQEQLAVLATARTAEQELNEIDTPIVSTIEDASDFFAGQAFGVVDASGDLFVVSTMEVSMLIFTSQISTIPQSISHSSWPNQWPDGGSRLPVMLALLSGGELWRL